MNNQLTPHFHAAVIKAWADGHIIQIKDPKGVWNDIFATNHLYTAPSFNPMHKYRIKPFYPTLAKIAKDAWYNNGDDQPTTNWEAVAAAVKAALESGEYS